MGTIDIGRYAQIPLKGEVKPQLSNTDSKAPTGKTKHGTKPTIFESYNGSTESNESIKGGEVVIGWND